MREKATNLKLGAIYINNANQQPERLVHIVPCEGAWLETYDGIGYGDTVSFEDVHYANTDEVQDFLEDAETYNNAQSTKRYDSVGVQLPPPPPVIYIDPREKV